jgi:penicillin-binding protein 1A
MSWRKRFLVVAVAAILGPTLLGAFVYATAQIPDPGAIAGAQSSIVFDYKGRELGRLHAAEDRIDIPLAEMPMHLRRAVLAAEDKNFSSHGGLSPLGMIRAAVKNVLSRSIKEGGSTITQQYVKNAFVGSTRTPWRKIREAAIAIKLERSRTKDQILEAYLNTIYFGRGAYGIGVAARTYFGHQAKQLTLAESALLAGIIRAPESLDPSKHPSRALVARNRVLDLMVKLRWADPAAAAAVKRGKICTSAAPGCSVVVRPRGASVSGRAPYFLEDVRRSLVQDYGAATVYRLGLRVTTTLDRDAQEAAEEAVRSILDRDTDPEAALVAIDPATGGVRAMVGGRNFARSEFNIASQAHRQPGSTFKPFVFAAAVQDQISPLQTFRAPATITLKTGFEPWTVSNYDRKDYGTLSLLDATKFSVNTVYAQMILEIGPEHARNMAKLAGIGSKLSAVPSLALGTSEVTPLELTSGYATFAARGSYAKPHLIQRIADARGKEMFKAQTESFSAVGEDIADTVNFALQKVVTEGTGRRAAIGRPAAGKTGTTESHRDAWFAGYTPNLAAVVWMGFPDGKRTMENVRGIAVTGGSFPARIWRAFMEKAVARMPVRAFAQPPPLSTPSPTPSPSPSATRPGGPLPTLPVPTGEPSGSPTPSESTSPSPTPTSSPSPTTSASTIPKPGAARDP